MVMTGMYIVFKQNDEIQEILSAERDRKSSNYKLSLKIEKHEKIAILAVSSFNTISSLISKALSYDSILDEEWKIILERNRWAWKTGNIEIEANELLRRNKIDVPTWVHVQNHVENCVQNDVQNRIQNRVQNHVKNSV